MTAQSYTKEQSRENIAKLVDQFHDDEHRLQHLAARFDTLAEARANGYTARRRGEILKTDETPLIQNHFA